MPAPDLLTLFALEPAIESGFAAIFESYGYTTSRQRGRDELNAPRIEVQYTNGPELSRVASIPQGQRVRDTWEGVVSVMIVTNREKNTPATLHDEMVARTRLVMRSFQNEITRERFPYHQVVRAIGQGDQPGVNPEKCEDLTALRFTVTVSIRKDAWPV